MGFTTRVLVLAHQTADSEGLAEALRRRSEGGDVFFTLLLPAGWREREAARVQLGSALTRLRGAGLDVEGRLCDADPIMAVTEVWDPGEFDEVIVSTLARDTSRWLAADLPHRIGRVTDAPVAHVVPSEIERALALERRPHPEHHDPQRSLGPFADPAIPEPGR